jgi:hypothetical protein
MLENSNNVKDKEEYKHDTLIGKIIERFDNDI